MNTVRGYFVALAIAILASAATLALAFLWWETRRGDQALERDLLDRANTLSQAVEREIRVATASLETLRHSVLLQQGDIQGFAEVAKRIHAEHPHWNGIVLTDRAGQQLMNLAAQPGQPLPNIGHYEVIRGALAGKASVSEVMRGRVLNVYLIAIDVPVRIKDEVVYALGLSIPSTHFQKLLGEHSLPEGWIAGIIDQKGIIVSRSLDPDQGIGSQTAPMWMQSEKASDLIRGRGRLGVPVVGAYVRSELTGWRSLISVPEHILTRERNQRLLFIAFGAGLLLVSSTAAAVYFGRRVVRPIETLARAADTYISGHPPADRHVQALKETRELAAALVHTGEVQRKTLAAKDAADKQFQILVEGVTDYALYMLDPNGIVTSWNTGAQRIKGYPPTEIIGKHFSEFYTEEDRQRDLPAEALRKAAAEGHYEAEGWRVRKDGGRFWASVVLNRLSAKDGSIFGFAKVTRDITQWREADENLKAAREHLFHSQKMEAVGHLTGGVAHDFNNLLTVIIGNLDTARRSLERWQEGAQQRIARALDSAMLGAQRAATLTSQLLAFSRRQPLEPRPIDVNRFLRDSAEFLRPSLGETINLEVVGAGGIWPIEADAGQLQTSILNLAINSRDAMPEGGKLTIEANNVFLDEEYCARNLEVTPGQYVAISVTDSGIGMTTEVMQRAYEPFFTTKAEGKGTGLGLSQVYGFIKQSGGHMKIYSEPGQGTTVRLYLRRSHVTSFIATDRIAGPAAGTEAILLVEDDGDVREYVSESLRELGYHITTAANAEAAIEVLTRELHFDLLLTDVVLPGMNGRQLAEYAVRRRPSLKILYMTGYSRNAIVHQGRLDAGVSLIQKPVTQSDLAARIRLVLDGSPRRRGD